MFIHIDWLHLTQCLMKWVWELVYVQELFTQTSGSWHIVCVWAQVWSHARIFTVCMQCMTLTWNCSIPAMILWIDKVCLSLLPSVLFHLLLNDKPMRQLIAACLLIIPPIMTKGNALFSCLCHKCCLCGLSWMILPIPAVCCLLSAHLTAASSKGLNHPVILYQVYVYQYHLSTKWLAVFFAYIYFNKI